MMTKALFSIISPAGTRARLSVLIFHRVLSQPDDLFPGEANARWFDEMLSWIRNWFNVLPLDEAIFRLKTSTLPMRAAAITFDDGYSDNYFVALPLLRKHNLTGTFFVATGFLDGGRMWNDTVIESVRRCKYAKLDIGHVRTAANCQLDSFPVTSNAEKRIAIKTILDQIKYLSVTDRESVMLAIQEKCGSVLPNDLMMTSKQVIDLRRSGMLIGAHTVTHPILANLPASEVRKEISDSKQFLESLLQEKISLFAYPNGKPNLDYQTKDASIIKELGFEAALTTAWGVADSGSDLMQLPRFTPWDRTKLRFGARLIKNILQNSRLKHSQTAN